MKTKIMLLSSIPKDEAVRKDWTDWRAEYENKIRKKIKDVTFLSGDSISDNVGPELVVGHDLWLIKQANIVIVDAKKKIGAGTAQEMVIGKYYKKPVISVIPKDTHYRKSEVAF